MDEQSKTKIRDKLNNLSEERGISISTHAKYVIEVLLDSYSTEMPKAWLNEAEELGYSPQKLQMKLHIKQTNLIDELDLLLVRISRQARTNQLTTPDLVHWFSIYLTRSWSQN